MQTRDLNASPGLQAVEGHSDLDISPPSWWIHSGFAAAPIVVIAICIGASLRMVAAAVGAGIGWEQTGGFTTGERLGYSLEELGAFGNGVGVALLVVGLVLLWLEAVGTQRSLTLHRRWLGVLFVLSGCGSATIIVGNAFLYAGLSSQRIEWSHVASTSVFAFAYLIVAVAGGLACSRFAAFDNGAPQVHERHWRRERVDERWPSG